MTDEMTATQPPDLVGARISHYVVTERLAQGGMGVVYRAVHHDPELRDMQRVIKMLLPYCAREADVVRRFKREAAIASRLRHPNIVQVYEFGVFEDQCYLVLPLLEGLPLDTLLARQPAHRMTEHRALRILVQVADALDHAHEANVIHRDLKPGNVFIIPENGIAECVKVIDFGIAKSGAPEQFATRAGAVMGTPAYMPPEQYVDAAQVTRQADIFALGVMAFEMVVGRLPWPNAHPFDPPQLPDPGTMSPWWPAFCQLILRALATDPSARWRSAGEFAIALASSLPATADEPGGDEILADFSSFKMPAARGGSDGSALYGSAVSWPAAPAASRSLPTKNELPPHAPFRTTLSGSSGASAIAATPTSSRSPRRWATAAMFGGIAIVAIAVAAMYDAGSDSVAPGPGSVPMMPAAPTTAEPSIMVTVDAGVADAAGSGDPTTKKEDTPAKSVELGQQETEATPTTNRGSQTKRAATSRKKAPVLRPEPPAEDDTYDPNAIGGEKKK